MSVNDAALQLGISRSSLYRYIERGDFPAIRLGTHGHIRVAQREIDVRVRQGIVLAG